MACKMDSDSDFSDSHSAQSFSEMEDDCDAALNETQCTKYHVLTPEEIVELMKEAIVEINLVIEMPATTTRILLSHLKWDKQELLEKLTDNQSDEFFKAAHVLNPMQKIVKKRVTLAQIECIICCTKYSAMAMVDLGCGHSFCKDCWAQYLHMKIMDEGASQMICCPASDCGIIVDDVTVMELVKDKDVKIKYQRLMTDSFVEHNRSLRWCPSPGCMYAIKADTLLVYRQGCVCKCGYELCFGCGQSSHDPIFCDLVKKWQLNGNEDTIAYIAKHTKACPKCNALIEKSGGCNHMICRKCRHDFCWLCFGNWDKHVSCNSYDARKATQNDSFGRFQHYFKRYMAHRRSVAIEEQNITRTVSDKIEDLMKYGNLSWSEVKFIKNSVNILIECRKEMMVSYIFAYYVKQSNQKAIFEMNQNDLEYAVEELSHYLELNIDKDDDTEQIKQQILSKSTYCDKRRKIMQDHIYEGYNDDWWSFE